MLLVEDIQACKTAADYFERLKGSNDLLHDHGFVEKYGKKASHIETYLNRAK